LPHLLNIFSVFFGVEEAQYENSYRRTAHHATVQSANALQSPVFVHTQRNTEVSQTALPIGIKLKIIPTK